MVDTCSLHLKKKSDLETAEISVANGYLWNAGIFGFSIKMFLEEWQKMVL